VPIGTIEVPIGTPDLHSFLGIFLGWELYLDVSWTHISDKIHLN